MGSIGSILKLLGPAWLQALLGLLALLAAWQYDRVSYGREKVVQHVEESRKQGVVRAEKAEQAHEKARKPGAFERMLKDKATCTDCWDKPKVTRLK